MESESLPSPGYDSGVVHPAPRGVGVDPGHPSCSFDESPNFRSSGARRATLLPDGRLSPLRNSRHIWLAAGLAVLWAALSGHAEAIIVAMGVASIALVVWLSSRAGLVDREGVPFDAVGRAVPYSVWMVGQILASNVALLRLLASPRPRIQPQVIDVPAGDGDSIAVVTFANSITMTPGTVTLQVEGGRVLVHALTDATAAQLTQGEMQRRSARLDAGHSDTRANGESQP